MKNNCTVKLILLIFVMFILIAESNTVQAGVLLQQNNLQYLGAFKVPWMRQGCDSWTDCVFGYGGNLIAFNSNGNAGKGSLFLGGNIQAQNLAEITIPNLVNTTDQAQLNEASMLQNFYDPTEGNQKKILTGGTTYSETVYKGGLLVYGNKLIGTVYTYYPGETQVLSHYTSSLNLALTGDFSGMYQVGNIPARMVGGYMATIPSEWQTALGGIALTGQAALPVISTTSSGPSASVFNPADFGVKYPVPATPVVYYPITNPLAAPETQNPYFNVSTSIKGIVFPAGSNSILFFGSHGTGPYCYGEQTLDPALDHQPVPGTSGDTYCYDPANSYKGPHMYPYKYQVWAYDVNDFIKVKSGIQKPWEIKPYAVWNFTLPFQPLSSDIYGATYDNQTQRIYLSQGNAAGGNIPFIAVFQVNLNSPKVPQNLQSTIVK